MVSVFAYHHYIRNSGALVATAVAVSGVPMKNEAVVKGYRGDFEYYNLSFSPVELSPEMGEIKLSLTMRRDFIPGQDHGTGVKRRNRNHLSNAIPLSTPIKEPAFQVVREKDGKIVFRSDFDWRETRETTALSENSKIVHTKSYRSTNSEGVKDGVHIYNLGDIYMPGAGTYHPSASYILMNKVSDFVFKNQADIKLEFRTGGKDLDPVVLMALIGGICVGLIIVVLTRKKID